MRSLLLSLSRHSPLMAPLATLGVAALLLVAGSAWAQAPGEDPVVLQNKTRVDMLLGPPAAKSEADQRNPGMSALLRARVARFESKAIAADGKDPNIKTERDVINTATSQGTRRTCIQEVGGATVPAGSQYGPKGPEQVVVLRGDLINVCK